MSVRGQKKYGNKINDILEDYKKGVSIAQMSSNYGVSATTILRYLDELGVEKREKIKHGGRKKRYEVNHNYFDNLNNENVRLLGFAYSNACFFEDVSGNKVFSFNLSPNRPLESLMWACGELSNATGDLEKYVYKRSNGEAYARFVSNHIYDRLEELHFKKEFPLFEDEEMNWNFYDEYFKHKVNIIQRGISIGRGKALINRTNIEKYLDNINVEWSKQNVPTIKILGKENIVNLCNHHPHIINKLKEYIDENGYNKLFSDVVAILRREGKWE